MARLWTYHSALFLDAGGLELNPEYVGLIKKRIAGLAGVRRLSHFGEAEA